MEITSAQYFTGPFGEEENAGIKATIDGKNYIIPLTLQNRRYAEIMRQVEAGELTIQDADD